MISGNTIFHTDNNKLKKEFIDADKAITIMHTMKGAKQ